jgi:hypothetical protein
MRKTLRTFALLLVLSCTTFAGEIHTPGSPAQPPPPSTLQEPAEGVSPDGEIHTPPGEMGTSGDIYAGVSESLAQVALDMLAVLQSIL